MRSAKVRGGVASQWIGAVLLGVATLATWWLWLGWDDTYDVDPLTGSRSGPYEAWQVIGCVLSLLVLAVLGGMALRPWLVLVVMTVVFTVAWSVAAAGQDDSGLWAVGAVLVAVGMAIGSTLFSLLGRAMPAARRRHA